LVFDVVIAIVKYNNTKLELPMLEKNILSGSKQNYDEDLRK